MDYVNEEQVKASGNSILRDNRGRLLPGARNNPTGRPPDTTEQKFIKKALKRWLKEYEQELAQSLPEIGPVLVKQAKRGDIRAIAEIHNVLGAHNKRDNDVLALKIDFDEDRKRYE